MDRESFLDRSLKIMRGVVVGSVVEQSSFMQALAILTRSAWQAHWHVAGGSLSYRMKREEVNKCRPSFSSDHGDWTPLGVRAQDLQDEHFVITAAESSFQTLAYDMTSELGIVEINSTGDCWRRVWGFERTGRPTHEWLIHFIAHAIRKHETNGIQRVAYHAYPPGLEALSKHVAAEKNASSLPNGMGLCVSEYSDVSKIAQESAGLFLLNTAAAWPSNGVFYTNESLDTTFDLVDSFEKEADLLLKENR